MLRRYLRALGVGVPMLLGALITLSAVRWVVAEEKAKVADAAVAAPDPKGDYVGSETCANCHAEAVEKFKKTFHGKKSLSDPKLSHGCESCHGPGAAHVNGGGDKTKIINPKDLTSRETADLCLGCHKDKALIMWKTSTHSQNNLACTKCHSVHEGEGRQSLAKGKTEICLTCHKKQKADMNLPSHHPVLEGKMECASCHNPHGGIEGNLKADSVNELCSKCHMDKTGPWKYEHPPVQDSCLNCHKPHGSANERLLAQPQNVLCQTCHVRMAIGGPGTVTHATTRLSLGEYNRCTDCHRGIHGDDTQSHFRNN